MFCCCCCCCHCRCWEAIPSFSLYTGKTLFAAAPFRVYSATVYECVFELLALVYDSTNAMFSIQSRSVFFFCSRFSLLDLLLCVWLCDCVVSFRFVLWVVGSIWIFIAHISHSYSVARFDYVFFVDLSVICLHFDCVICTICIVVFDASGYLNWCVQCETKCF